MAQKYYLKGHLPGVRSAPRQSVWPPRNGAVGNSSRLVAFGLPIAANTNHGRTRHNIDQVVRSYLAPSRMTPRPFLIARR
jgi:hypothetical protein